MAESEVGSRRSRPGVAPAGGLDAGLVLAATLLAFSPVLVDLAGHVIRERWAAYCLVFPVLAIVATRCDRRRLRARGVGLAGIGAGVAVELFGLVLAAPRYGRPGLALGVLGALLFSGALAPAALPLVLLCFPVPFAAFRPFDPAVPAALARMAGALAGRVGIELSVVGSRLLDARGEVLFTFRPPDVGLASALLFGGLAWYHGVRRGRAWTASLRDSALWALAGMLAHQGTVLLEALVAAGGRSGPEPSFVAWLWAGATLLVLVSAERRRPRTPEG